VLIEMLMDCQQP